MDANNSWPASRLPWSYHSHLGLMATHSTRAGARSQEVIERYGTMQHNVLALTQQRVQFATLWTCEMSLLHCACAPAGAYVVVPMGQVSTCPDKARIRGLLGKDTVLPHEKASR